MEHQLERLVEANGAHNCTLRLVIVRNGGGIWAGPSNGRASDIIALTSDSKDWGDGVKLAYQREGRHACLDRGVDVGTHITGGRARCQHADRLQHAKHRGREVALRDRRRGLEW